MTPALKMQRAKIGLILDQPFFGSLVMGLRFREDKAGSVTKTMATDGESLFWFPDFVAELTEKTCATVLAHEALHCALLHPLRMGERDGEKWNIAADHAVNLVLDGANEEAKSKGKAAPFPWPDKVKPLKDPAFKGMSAEEIYGRLPQSAPQGQGQAKQPGQGQGQGQPSKDPGGLGGVIPGPKDEAGQQEMEAKWKVGLTQAAAAAKGRGELPSDVARLVEDTLNPPSRWQDLLRAFIREWCKDDYSWTRPNARYLASGFMLPSLHSQRLGKLAVAIDTSGSIDRPLLDVFLGEVEAIVHECRPSGITLIDCDADVQSVRECEPLDPLPRDFKGGGGTSFIPVFTHLENEPPVALVYFTDLDGSFPKSEPSFPVLWATREDKQAPFGVTVKLNAI